MATIRLTNECRQAPNVEVIALKAQSTKRMKKNGVVILFANPARIECISVKPPVKITMMNRDEKESGNMIHIRPDKENVNRTFFISIMNNRCHEVRSKKNWPKPDKKSCKKENSIDHTY
ncbi:hypothetical protein RCO48_20745 [Peribacillus frigoritolerans]|nr:hypothetical protein [Peribacillus frigoritolerans]